MWQRLVITELCAQMVSQGGLDLQGWTGLQKKKIDLQGYVWYSSSWSHYGSPDSPKMAPFGSFEGAGGAMWPNFVTIQEKQDVH